MTKIKTGVIKIKKPKNNIDYNKKVYFIKITEFIVNSSHIFYYIVFYDENKNIINYEVIKYLDRYTYLINEFDKFNKNYENKYYKVIEYKKENKILSMDYNFT